MLASLALTLFCSYLIGAIPFGYLVARARGVDIFQHGSGNIGATNVGRVLGKRFGILVLLLDFAKGAAPVALAPLLFRTTDSDWPADTLPVAAGLAAFLGHLFPIYLRFRGGKGVATGAGVVAVLVPGPALAAMLFWLVAVVATRYVSLASVLSVFALVGARLAFRPDPFAADHCLSTSFCLLAAALVILRHRGNLSRLLHGTENRLKDTSTMHLLSKTLHVLALGLWFGSVVFFSLIAALVIFHTFESLSAQSAPERPAWLPDSFDKAKGTQLAGIAVGPIFPWYFLLQGVCALLATGTALAWSWSRPAERLHKVRSLILLLALASVVAGWPLAQKVSELRMSRYDSDPAIAAAAKESFGAWHGYSLLLNMVTLGLVTAGMALAAQLPAPVERKEGDRADSK